MNILIVDDELPAIRNLERVVKEVEPNACVYTADEYSKAISLCDSVKMDVVFMDVEMPGMDGISLAGKLKAIQPVINIIMTTAYEKYSLDAFKIYASGYLLKPVTAAHVREALDNLRNPIGATRQGLYIQCFGHFEVFYDGEIVQFGRSRAKEVLAYLVDRKGAAVNNAEMCAVLFEDDESDPVKQRNYFHHLYNNLQSTLEKYGCDDILVKGYNSYSVATEKFQCDYYEALKKDSQVLKNYMGEYMSQYSWAEGRIGIYEY